MTGLARGQDWDRLIVLCAPNRFDGMPLADWHLARELSRHVPVLYVDPPLSPLAPLRNRGASSQGRPGLQVTGPGFARLTPVGPPFPSRPGVTGLTAAAARSSVRRAVARLGGRVLAVVSGWPLYPMHGTFGRSLTVYWAQDDFVAGAALLGESARLLERRERKIASSAGLVIAANPDVAAGWRARGLEPVLIPFGTDSAAYADVDRVPVPPDAVLPGPVAGFVGHINRRIDLSLLEGIAARGLSLLLVGPLDPRFEPERFATLTARRNVRWVGEKPFAALPGYLRAIDVGLVPYSDSGFNRGSFPLKTLEYLAAGRPVVGTDLPATRWLGTDLVRIAAGTEDFADLAVRLAGQQRNPELVTRRREFAGRHSWARRAEQFVAAISAHSSEAGTTERISRANAGAAGRS